MAPSGNDSYSLEEQKRILHRVLLSKPDGYTSIQRILNDLKSERDIDGEHLADKFGYQEFSTFLRSACMSKYCHVKDEGHITTYSGIPDSKVNHLVEELRASHEAKQLQKPEKSNTRKRRNGTMESDSNRQKPQRQVGFLQRSDSERSAIPRDHRFVPANSTTKETDTQTDCKDQEEKAVQTESLMCGIPLHEIFATLKFLKEPYAKGQFIDRHPKPLCSAIRKIPLEYYGNLTAGKMISAIFSKYDKDDDIHNFIVHTIHYFNREFNGLVEVSSTNQVVPKGKYIIELTRKGGLTRRQLEEKLGYYEAQLLKSSERIKELEVAPVELYKSEARNRELLESNRNLEAKLGQLDLNRLKVIIKEFSDNLENTEIYRSENLHNTMSAELEAKQHRQGEIVTNTEKSGNMFGIFATEMFHRYPAEEDE